eukprot:TRINITY_DN236_c1_g1_i1.p1 TRINITY_DN236_c1_g1~~TRINITY_DN236_c1_g1_i1.p1  ORF type:complete len:428 (+),score=54.63 TRINITY_DN236_c1_g1_i1:166-1449(+)
MRGVNNSVDTINAAATAIISAESRVQQATVQKRRWGSCWSLYWCFGSQRQAKRIGHAVLVPEPTSPETSGSTAGIPSHPPSLILPFIAPPSSPASFLQSEPPSATHSPAGLLSLASLSSDVYSPGGPASIFAIGPYANETQLVSPPVFSTFTTEPSTAPLTPPPEPVHLTRPSSPEVPFAKLLSSLDPTHRTSAESRQKFPSSQHEFQSYQLYPGSPIGHLISPSSVISGSGPSSPFPDLEFPYGSASFPAFPTCEPPKLLSIDGLAARKSLVWQECGSSDATGPQSKDCLLLKDRISAITSRDEAVVNHRVSFELTAEEVAESRTEKEQVVAADHITESSPEVAVAAAERERLSGGVENPCEFRVVETYEDSPVKDLEKVGDQQQQPSLTLGTHKEFKFDNEKVVGTETGPRSNWAFFPMIQPGVS